MTLQNERRRHVVISLMDRNATILGGQEIRWGRIVQALAACNESDITILCTSSLLKAWDRGEVGRVEANVTIFSESRTKLGTWVAAQLFALRHIRRGSIVQLTGPGMLILPAAIVARFLKGCTLLTSLATSRVLPFRKERFPRKGYWMFWAALKASHLVDALNPKIDVAELIDSGKLSIAPCSFSDPQRFQSSGRKTKRVVFAAHFTWQKGCDLLLGIVRAWPDDADCQLVLCGSGPYGPALAFEARTHSNVKIERSSDLAGVLADANVFLSLQQWDNYPSQSLLEAMLCECCIVATDVGDTALLVDGPWGVRLPVDAPPRAYVDAAMQFLTTESSARQQAGAAARKFIIRYHSRDRYLTYLRSLWDAADSIASARRA